MYIKCISWIIKYLLIPRVILTHRYNWASSVPVPCSYPSSRSTIHRNMCNFYVLLTVHLGIILVSNQLDPQFVFLICLFQFSTCFEQHRAHQQENQVFQYDIWFMSIFVGDRLVCRSGRKDFLPDLHTRRSPTQSDIKQMSYWNTWFSWWWARCCSKHVESWNKHKRKTNCGSSLLLTRMCNFKYDILNFRTNLMEKFYWFVCFGSTFLFFPFWE